MKLILASNSPRRKELLAGLKLPFEVRTLDNIDESFPTTLIEGEIPLYIARAKADAYRKTIKKDELLITADTIVWVNGFTLGKPADEADAIRMLGLLSNKTHQVYTGVCLTTQTEQRFFHCRTDVTFANLSESEIKDYVVNYHPMDKAGSYGIQEWIGYIGCTGIKGSYYNVMGLPIQRLYIELKAMGIIENH